jgi:hypothetical protein
VLAEVLTKQTVRQSRSLNLFWDTGSVANVVKRRMPQLIAAVTVFAIAVTTFDYSGPLNCRCGGMCDHRQTSREKSVVSAKPYLNRTIEQGENRDFSRQHC